MEIAAHPAVLGLIAVAGLSFGVKVLVVGLVRRDGICVPEDSDSGVRPVGVKLLVYDEPEVVPFLNYRLKAVDFQPGFVLGLYRVWGGFRLVRRCQRLGRGVGEVRQQDGQGNKPRQGH